MERSVLSLVYLHIDRCLQGARGEASGHLDGEPVLVSQRKTGETGRGRGKNGREMGECMNGARILVSNKRPSPRLVFTSTDFILSCVLMLMVFQNCLVLVCVERPPPTYTHRNRVWEPEWSYSTLSTVYNIYIEKDYTTAFWCQKRGSNRPSHKTTPTLLLVMLNVLTKVGIP